MFRIWKGSGRVSSLWGAFDSTSRARDEHPLRPPRRRTPFRGARPAPQAGHRSPPHLQKRERQRSGRLEPHRDRIHRGGFREGKSLH
ncbi:MAG: hypothetical protein MZV64_23120 [Ignavibacteriales bacterium]|nr:hypothetical protein [Ignavibacteriales bacterium]